MNDPWTLVETGFRPETARAVEGLFTQGSGPLHVRGSLEEHLAGTPQNVEYERRPGNTTAEQFPDFVLRWGTYVPGVFGPHPWLRREMINLPWPLGLAPTVAGERLDVTQSRVERYRRELNLRDATLRRDLLWHTRAGATLTVRFERFVSATRPRLIVQRMTLAADREVEVTVEAGLDADVRTNGHDHLTSWGFAPAEDGVAGTVETDGGDEVTYLAHLWPRADWAFATEARAARVTAALAASPEAPLVVEKRTVVTTSRDLHPAAPEDLMEEAAALTYDELHAEHAALWAARWDASDVVVEGDPAAQRALRASAYHLLRAVVRGDDRVAVGAKGHAGEAYRGHYFWDTEMYLLPFYLYTEPGAALSLVGFRVRTLEAARRRATFYGYPGAKYPWQSDTDGNECCTQFQYADHEVHVTAAVTYGLAHYAAATGDAAFLDGPAAEVLAETARYWLARMDRRPGDDHPSLLGVMGPDEYTPLSSNNAYTNRMAAYGLALAAAHGEAGGATDAERAAFAEAAEGLPLLRRADGLVLQCEEFGRLAEPDFDAQWPDRSRPYAAFVSQERLYRTKCLKQADVLMLMMLFPDAFTDAEVEQAYEHYLPVTTHDSSLSAAIHAIVALRLGRIAEAYRFWQLSAGKDLDLAHGGAAEGVHIAGAGGSWQVAVLGFAGLRTALQAEHLTLRPRLPRAWTRLAFPLAWKGCPVYVDITPERTEVTNRGARPIEVEVAGERRAIAPGTSEGFPGAAKETA